MNTKFPFVSILLPVRNEGRFIHRALQAVYAQDYPKELIEVIVIDGMSTDNTREVIRDWMSQHENLSMIVNPKGIVPAGLNLGILAARGEVIVRVDGHCVIQYDYVKQCIEKITGEGVEAVGGSTLTIGETYTARAIAIAMSSPFGVGNSTFRVTQGKTEFVDSVPFPAYHRKVFQTTGLYDEEMVRDQDDEFNYRLRKYGYKILLSKDIHSDYFSRSSVTSLWRQYYQYGFWKIRVLQKNPRQMRVRQFIPPALVISIIGSATLGIIFWPFWWLIGVTAGAYLVTNLAVSIITASRTQFRYLPLLPMVFATLHFSYGFGFLAGLVRFANRWGDREGTTPKMSNTEVYGQFG